MLAGGGEEQLVLEEADRERQRGERRAATPLATASDRQLARQAAQRESRVSPVASVTAPAVMNSALLAIACAIT